jgi:hypothetical protein
MAENTDYQSLESFVYQPLDPSKREIRLFHLNRTDSSDNVEIITGAIVHVSLDNHFDCDAETCYDTVSYAWGNPELSKKVLVDGYTLPVTRNAESALRSMRLTEETRRVWIDSICIDQTNLEERAQQVMLMGSIYEDSCLNVIHLFEDDRPMLNRAIANINAIYEEILADINDLVDCDKSVDSNKLPKFQSFVFEEKDYGRHWTKSQTPLKTELDVEALLKFFSNPWF